jgi:alpha-aminoadipic semialdehyde synthase
VLVQPFENRAYSHEEYVNAGAIIQEDLAEAQLVMSVKQVRIDDLMANKTYGMNKI